MELRVRDMIEGYVQVCHLVYYRGSQSSPRGMKTRELLGTTIRVTNPRVTLPVGVGRKVNPRLAWLEALQLVGGFQAPEAMGEHFRPFMDGQAFAGAYGPRIRNQLPMVQGRLLQDPDTRQAIVTIWDPIQDLVGSPRRDVPCTIGFQFFIRHGRLDMHVHMRSNDVWLGLAYDCFQFTRLQCTMAECIGAVAGEYVHHVGSLHLYERDVEKVLELHDPVQPHCGNVYSGLWLGDWKTTREACEDVVCRGDTGRTLEKHEYLQAYKAIHG